MCRCRRQQICTRPVRLTDTSSSQLTINDLVRRKFTDPETGRIHLWQELLAGGAAGAGQVIVTNPLEITKIRLQMQGELAKEGVQVARGIVPIVRSLGIVGLYRGAGACLLRDAPFSLIYFTSYAHLKKDLFGEGKNGKQLSNLETLLAAGMGGMPAAYLTTPADVVKTRLQTEARAGQTHVSLSRPCAFLFLPHRGMLMKPISLRF